MPDLRIDTEDFNDPWRAHNNATGKGNTSGHILDPSADHNEAQDDIYVNGMQENNEAIPYDCNSGFGADDDYEDIYTAMPPLQPTFAIPPHSACQASLHPPPTSRRGSVQPHLPSSRQGSVQPHLPASRQGSVHPHLPSSRQGSVQPHLLASYQGDEVSIYEQSPIDAPVSKKRSYTNVGGPNGPRPKRQARKVPQTPIRPLQKTRIVAGPSTGTRSQARKTKPTIVMTDATPVSGASSNHHVAALLLDDEVDTASHNFLVEDEDD